MSGDSSDFDGYLIAAAIPRMRQWVSEHAMSSRTFGGATTTLDVVIALPDRIACKDLTSTDPMQHDRGRTRHRFGAS